LIQEESRIGLQSILNTEFDERPVRGANAAEYLLQDAILIVLRERPEAVGLEALWAVVGIGAEQLLCVQLEQEFALRFQLLDDWCRNGLPKKSSQSHRRSRLVARLMTGLAMSPGLVTAGRVWRAG
jgi:hypothetical protein